MLLLVISRMLGLFVNRSTADEKYILLNRENLSSSSQMQLSKKQNVFRIFLLYLSNLHQTFNILKEKVSLLAYVFLKI